MCSEAVLALVAALAVGYELDATPWRVAVVVVAPAAAVAVVVSPGGQSKEL
jgi:hypothetical protein